MNEPNDEICDTGRAGPVSVGMGGCSAHPHSLLSFNRIQMERPFPLLASLTPSLLADPVDHTISSTLAAHVQSLFGWG